MITILFLLFPNLFVDKDVYLLIAQLGDKSYRTRENAQSQLLKRNSYALVIALRRVNTNDLETIRRKSTIIDVYWHKIIPPPDKCPYIDALSKSFGSYDGFINKYHRASVHINNCAPRYEGDRYATWLMMHDLGKHEIPPFIIKLMLAYMQIRTDEYDRKQRNFQNGNGH